MKIYEIKPSVPLEIVCNAKHDFSEWLKTCYNPAYVNQFRSHNEKSYNLKFLLWQSAEQTILRVTQQTSLPGWPVLPAVLVKVTS